MPFDRTEHMTAKNASRHPGDRSKCRKATASLFKGVYRNKGSHTWVARIRIKGRLVGLGSYRDDEDAARAYDRAAREHFGAFARLNFPDNGELSAHGED